MKKKTGVMLCISGILPAVTFSPDCMSLPTYCAIAALGVAAVVCGGKMAGIFIKTDKRLRENSFFPKDGERAAYKRMIAGKSRKSA